ncbi:MAG: lipase [Oscillatoriales cyanobacterium SM2_1_8]|nr:lipase [Oscillatoriales cyanobacterium SM2_1_8]
MEPWVIVPGYLADAQEYNGLRQTLGDRGEVATVVPLRWWDWLVTLGGRPVTPILEALAATVERVLQETGAPRVRLLAHSAGGWVSRVYLGDRPYCGQTWHGRERVTTLVSLGTPHTSRERWTRRNLDFVNETYPGAFYDEVRYICLAGKSVFGDRRPQSLAAWIAANSYEMTAGERHTWGDGISPIVSAHLDRACNVVLPGVHHAPRAGLWYGSPEAIDRWFPYVLHPNPTVNVSWLA